MDKKNNSSYANQLEGTTTISTDLNTFFSANPQTHKWPEHTSNLQGHPFTCYVSFQKTNNQYNIYIDTICMAKWMYYFKHTQKKHFIGKLGNTLALHKLKTC